MEHWFSLRTIYYCVPLVFLVTIIAVSDVSPIMVWNNSTVPLVPFQQRNVIFSDPKTVFWTNQKSRIRTLDLQLNRLPALLTEPHLYCFLAGACVYSIWYLEFLFRFSPPIVFRLFLSNWKWLCFPQQARLIIMNALDWPPYTVTLDWVEMILAQIQ